MNYNLIKNKRGFTLIELIVSISIIALISSIVLANFNSYKRSGGLSASTQLIMSDIRKAQSYALSLKDFGSTGNYPMGGWGVYFDIAGNRYIIFADLNGDYKWNGDSESVEVKNLPSGIKISNITSLPAGSSNTANIAFLPPAPKVYLTHGGSDRNTIIITLEDDIGGSKNIFMNKFGLVEVN